MEFKQGDRVYVKKFMGEPTNFYATLTDFQSDIRVARLINCTGGFHEKAWVQLPNHKNFGETDYYTLATDEEDTEEPAIQHDKLIKDIEKLKEEKAAIEMYLDAVKVYKPMYEEVNRKYKKLTEHIRLKELHNPSISRYKDLMYFINEMEDK